MELSKLQQEIIDAPYNKIVVISSAASGKTRTMTEKVRQLLRAGVNPKEVAVITFTNMAASELKSRLGEDYKDGLFVGTIHALANYFLLSSGIKTDKILNKEKFDELFEMVDEHRECIKPIEYLLLDEGQDTDALQFRFLFEIINPHSFFICSDPKQCIYGFRGSRPDLLLKLSQERDVKVFDMNENYRNGANILNYAKKLIAPTGLIDTSISKSPYNGTVTEMSYSESAIIGKIQGARNYGDWAILTRTNYEIDNISYALKRANIPFDTFKQGDLSKEELNSRMSKNTVKLLTVHSAKGLEWDNVIVTGMRYFNSEERNVCYVAATRARKNLYWMRSSVRRRGKSFGS